MTPARRLALAACASLLLPVLWSGPALAIFGGGKCDPTDNDRREASRAIRAINGRIDAAEKAIVETLRLQTGQLAGYQAQSTKALTQALDSQTRLQAQTAREVEETRAMRAHRPTRLACRTGTGLAGLGAAREASADAAGRAGSVETGRIVGDRAVVKAPGAAADSAARFRAVTGSWCNPERSGDKACRGAGTQHAADIRPGTLFDTRTISTEAELRAAVDLARNLAAPVIVDPPALAAAETDAERRRVLLARSADARTALASDFFARARSLRAPGPDLGAWANALAPGSGDPARPISRYALLELLASTRFESPDWVRSLQEQSTENLLRMLIRLQAVSLTLDWERFRLEEQRGAMEAAGLAIATEATRRLPGLANPSAGVN